MASNDHPGANAGLHSACAAFIHEAVVPAQQSELVTGVPASITIAQAILESGWGKRHMGAANNYFGVKAQVNKDGNITYGSVASGYVDLKTREHFHGKDVYVSDHFRSYKSMADSFIDHGLFLKNNHRYHAALAAYAQNHDADDFARGLQKAGYATDPNYGNLLISLMKKYNLYQYNHKARSEKGLVEEESIWV